MTQDDADVINLKNAEAIIERFGGIRPMAAKLGIPVTTVQGWKKRGEIPGTRKEDIIRAANDNNLAIDDLLSGAQEHTQTPFNVNQASSFHQPVAPVSEPAQKDDGPKISIEPILKPQPKAIPASLQPRDQTHEDLMAAIAASQKKAVRASLWGAAAFIAIFAGLGALLLWPSAKKIEQHDQQIAGLEGKIEAISGDIKTVNESASALQGLLPSDLQKTMADLKTQAQTVQKTVADVSAQAQSLQQAMTDSKAGSLVDRLAVLESKFDSMQGSQAMKDLAARINTLEVSIVGQSQLSASVDELRKIVDSIDGQVNTLDAQLAAEQARPESPLGQTLEGVTGSDLKAAAMLIAFSQFRDSLNRQQPFEDDLVLLQKLVGSSDPELQAALTRLAPQAKTGGILTQEGLSQEFKGLAGDIVVSSLKGDDVSIFEQAKIRLNQVVNITKKGEAVGGTPTQQAVATAQSQLDSGDVQGAIATLQALDGPQRQAAQPFIDKAQATMLAGQVESMLRQMILANVGTGLPTASGKPLTPPTAMDQAIQSAIPGGEVITDPQSGITILPAPKGFKGFSSGQTE